MKKKRKKVSFFQRGKIVVCLKKNTLFHENIKKETL